MNIQPNQRRRTRLVRAASAIVALLLGASVLVSGWTLPSPPLTGAATSSPAPSAAPSAGAVATAPAQPSPSPGPSAPAPGPTASPPVIVDGCVVPPAGLEPAIVASHGARNVKTIALTFDDGTNPRVVERLVTLLRNQHVNATFFPTGRSVERFPDVWRRAAAYGYPIGNHTYHHRSLEGQCYADQLAELRRNERVIDGLGLSLVPLMRPPFEDFDDGTALAASSAGIERIVLWDVDTLDWTGLGWREITRRAMAGAPGSIVLLHLKTNAVVYAVRRIVARYRARGFTFVTIGQMLGVEGPVPFP